ncbi:MAG: T9SS type A sorting domain-containing protein [Saprospiraceae bacterium]|nr:T9SS type A sorting domain-containing protein [Bacteroidia bacterium]NNL92383.1 T9SS type A sorting domain-containing protein [Saprospiraceae bacterium]
MTKFFTRGLILMLCIFTTSLIYSQEYGSSAASIAERSNCGKKGNIAKVEFEDGVEGESTQIIVVCGSDLSGPANAACLNKLASDNLTGDDFKCGPCEIEEACQMTITELYKGNNTNDYDGANPNPTPSSTFTIFGVTFCVHDVACKTYPGEKKWKAKFDCSECEWPSKVDRVGFKNLDFPKEEIIALQESFNVSPNPSVGHIDLKITNVTAEESVSFIVFDQAGKMVIEKEFTNPNNFINDQIDLNGVSTGLYFYTIVVDGIVLPAKKLSIIE